MISFFGESPPLGYWEGLFSRMIHCPTPTENDLKDFIH